MSCSDNTEAANSSSVPSADRSREIYRRIRGMIISGELPAGSRLKQVHLARSLDVSPTPVREAIRLLEQEGWVVSDFYRGSVVKTYTEKDVKDIYELREVLEGLIARKAATQLSDEQVATLEGLALRADAEDTELDGVGTKISDKMDVDFHLTLARFVGNEQIERIFDRLISVELLLVAGSFLATPPDCSHVQIMRAIRARDPGWAEAVAKRHVRDACSRLPGDPTGMYRVSSNGRRHALSSTGKTS